MESLALAAEPAVNDRRDRLVLVESVADIQEAAAGLAEVLEFDPDETDVFVKFLVEETLPTADTHPYLEAALAKAAPFVERYLDMPKDTGDDEQQMLEDLIKDTILVSRFTLFNQTNLPLSLSASRKAISSSLGIRLTQDKASRLQVEAINDLIQLARAARDNPELITVVEEPIPAQELAIIEETLAQTPRATARSPFVTKPRKARVYKQAIGLYEDGTNPDWLEDLSEGVQRVAIFVLSGRAPKGFNSSNIDGKTLRLAKQALAGRDELLKSEAALARFQSLNKPLPVGERELRYVHARGMDDIQIPELPWVSGANCQGFDIDLFFTEQGGSLRKARAICARCRVRTDCLEYALDENEAYGVWGGLSELERTRVGKSRKLHERFRS